ncbi:MAG: KH domain-containing protein [Fimbriimonadaceae bacterium]|nr:KH domain-containing protein [Fimbriimonadaceae bacterium]
MSYRPLVEHLVKSVVTEPDSVTVKEVKDRDGLLFNVTVSPSDVGKVIGKGGRVVSAIRYVVSAAAAKGRQKAYIKVLTDD